MKKLEFFKKFILLLLMSPLCYLSGLSPDSLNLLANRALYQHRHHQHNVQPGVYINQGLDYRYRYDIYGIPYTTTEIRGNKIIQSYQLPPQRRLEYPTQQQNKPLPTNKDFLQNR